MKNRDIFIFDLDQTLYPNDSNIIKQIDRRIGTFCADLLTVSLEEGCRIGAQLNTDYGTTLNGLKQKHDVDVNKYLFDVHNVDY